jgi:hypothetical protein
MQQRNGTVYGPGATSPARVDRGEVTASFEPTVAMFFPPQDVVAPRTWRMFGRVLMVVGGLAIVAICAGLGLFLASTAFCPCTFGGP